MTLKANESDSFPGARLVAVNPITSGECCQHATTESLAVAVLAAGGAATFRGGKLFLEVSEGTELDVCSGPAPTISGMDSDQWENNVTRLIQGVDKGTAEGEVWVGDAATWDASVLRVQQTVDTWLGDDIEITTVQGGFPLSPPVAYAYVFNACGRPNAVGFEMAWIEV